MKTSMLTVCFFSWESDDSAISLLKYKRELNLLTKLMQIIMTHSCSFWCCSLYYKKRKKKDYTCYITGPNLGMESNEAPGGSVTGS